MRNNIRLSALFAGLAILVAGVGFGTAGPGEAFVTPDAATSWATAFPVAQAGFAQPAQPTN